MRGVPAAVLPYLVDLSPFQPLPGAELARSAYPAAAGDVPKILFLSRLHEKKGVDILIDAAHLLHRAGRRFTLIIAGNGSPQYEAQLREQVRRLGLGDVVAFLGLVTGAQKISLYQAADVYVLPTHQENFGLVLVEALAAGTPVVTTRGTDIWREIQSAGGTIADNTPAAMADAIGRLLDDRPSLPALGQRGRNWVLKNLYADRMAADYETMYAEVIREQRSRQ